MIKIRRSNERGHANHGWLDSHFSFSFADYYDPAHMGFRSLRVINEDVIAPGMGFGTHGHKDMEILTYVLKGSLAHRDSMGHEERLGPNEVQRMSAGTGIRHSEYNGSATEPVHLLQIWIEPASLHAAPSYEQFRFDAAEKTGKLKQLAGPESTPGVARINQDALLFVADVSTGEEVQHEIAANRHAWVQVIRGDITVNGVTLLAGDAAAISNEDSLSFRGKAEQASEFLLFDLA